MRPAQVTKNRNLLHVSMKVFEQVLIEDWRRECARNRFSQKYSYNQSDQEYLVKRPTNIPERRNQSKAFSSSRRGPIDSLDSIGSMYEYFPHSITYSSNVSMDLQHRQHDIFQRHRNNQPCQHKHVLQNEFCLIRIIDRNRMTERTGSMFVTVTTATSIIRHAKIKCINTGIGMG